MRVLVIGATSYVASYFLDECFRRGWDAVALVRDRVRHAILAKSDRSIPSVSSPDDLRSLGSADAIVNFAYPKDLGALEIHRATRLLINQMVDAVQLLAPRILIHVSTQSVFGYAFRRPPRPAPVWWAFGDSYVETKALAEWLLILRARRNPCAKVVLRLGNVIGPGSYWTSELARRILFQEPVGRGASNATYVRNVVDYICHLLSAGAGPLREFGLFHHLAELSNYTWPSIAEPIGELLRVSPFYGGGPVRLKRASARGMAKAAVRYSAMVLPEELRQRLARLTDRGRAVYRLQLAGDDDYAIPPTLYQAVEFTSHTLPGWAPPYDLRAALGDVLAWIRDAGYVSAPMSRVSRPAPQGGIAR